MIIPQKRPEKQAPLSYRRYPVNELRGLPVRDTPRCVCLSYEPTVAPGMKNPCAGRPRTHGHGAVRLFGERIVAVCLAWDDGRWFLEASVLAYDEARDKREALDLPPQILADIYRVVQQRQIAGQARSYGRAEGRN